VVEAHGGTLTHEPNPDGGTVFRFTLPVPANAQAETAPALPAC
jgi:two-component system sensor histidine kinase DctS